MLTINSNFIYHFFFTSYEGETSLVLVNWHEKRATDRIWTGDLILTKDALYQLSYCSFLLRSVGLPLALLRFSLSGRRGSNPPPIAWKAIALPNELLPLLSRLWGRVDSNHWTPKRTDLQSVAIATMRLPHLLSRWCPSIFEGAHRADEGTRTPDRLITNQLLYQLSYIGFFSFVKQLSFFLIWGCKDTTFFSSRKFFFFFSSNYFLLHWLSYLFFHPLLHPFTLSGTVFCPFVPSFTPILGFAIRHLTRIIVLFFVNQ